jgi:hypothetical protein
VSAGLEGAAPLLVIVSVRPGGIIVVGAVDGATAHPPDSAAMASAARNPVFRL